MSQTLPGIRSFQSQPQTSRDIRGLFFIIIAKLTNGTSWYMQKKYTIFKIKNKNMQETNNPKNLRGKKRANK